MSTYTVSPQQLCRFALSDACSNLVATITSPTVSLAKADVILHYWDLYNACMPANARVKRFQRLSYLKFGSSIDESQQCNMYSALCACEQLFAVELDDLGCVDTHLYSVRLVGGESPAQPPIKYYSATR